MASDFAAAFGAFELAYYVGLWHDVGKFHPAWQRYLVASEANPGLRGRGPDHKAAGAMLAAERIGPAALAIGGHHGGLPAPKASATPGFRALRQLIEDERERAVQALELARAAVPNLEPVERLELPEHLDDPLKADLFIRMLFSALVDADYLDTEAHFTLYDANLRKRPMADLSVLFDRLQQSQIARFRMAPDTEVNRARADVYAACRAAAEQPPGFFRLTVPTGGGKTRSGLAFALKHAANHGLRRVVVAVPFISITEQTAAEYRGVFGDWADDGIVLEHHSSVAEAFDEDEVGEVGGASLSARLATENWDAPIVVTTTVQLFESLLHRKPAKMRKVHRLARSVIILDEAQALPPRLLEPVLDVLRGLVDDYGATVVLSTATQPAFESIPAFQGIDAAEIVPVPARHFRALERVTYDRRARPLSWTEVAAEVAAEPRSLAIVNTKADAMALIDALEAAGGRDILHLSTLLCGAHRRRTIEEVKRRQQTGRPCRLVSTQVVEAGVDIDFPIVFRAFGPLDAMVQAAGRCNREGTLGTRGGRVVVFEPTQGGTPPGYYKTARDTARTALNMLPDRRPDDLDLVRRYFELLYDAVPADAEAVQDSRRRLDFPTVAARFRLIEDEGIPVAVTSYGEPGERTRVRGWLDELRRGTARGRELRRRLQPYVVSLRTRELDRQVRNGLVVEAVPGLGEWLGDYDLLRGVQPHALVV